MLTSCSFIAQLICGFVFAYMQNIWFSHDVAHIGPDQSAPCSNNDQISVYTVSLKPRITTVTY